MWLSDYSHPEAAWKTVVTIIIITVMARNT